MRGNARDHELRDARADRQLDDLRASAARCVIDDPDFTQRRLSGDHALLSQAQKDAVRGGCRHEDDGDDQQGQAGDEERKSLRPAREDRSDETSDRRANHKPAEGRDDRARVHDVTYPRDRPQARGHERACRVHDARRKRSLSLAETGIHALHDVPPIVSPRRDYYRRGSQLCTTTLPLMAIWEPANVATPDSTLGPSTTTLY